MAGTVSVIIPVYNRQDYIKECVESILNQSYQDFEIILIDDGSADKSASICREIAKADKRVTFLESGHLGVSGARNIGLDAASGEFVFFVDSDDVIHKDLIKTMVDALTAHGANIGGTKNFNIIKSNWNKAEMLKTADMSGFEVIHKPFEESVNALFTGISPFGTLGGTMIRRSIIGDTRFSNELFIGEDFYFVYENVCKGSDIVILGGKWYLARLHESNISWNYGYDGFATRFLRRKLVWQNEERSGRIENSKHQKVDAFSCFKNCVTKHKPHSDVAKKMRKTVKENKKDILPILSGGAKLSYFTFMYFPTLANALFKIKHKSKTQLPKLTSVSKTAKITDENLNILRTFLDVSLLSGDEIFEKFKALENARYGCGKNPLEKYIYVPGSRTDRTVLVAHTDTVWDSAYNKPFDGEQSLIYDGGVFSSGNEGCGIGADDRAGCAMLWALKDSGHSLLLLSGEEHGKIGAKFLKSSAPDLYKEINDHRFMMELDWAGSGGCLYNGVPNSDKFKNYINQELNIKEDNFKGGCDLSILCDKICGVNLGVGYHKHHTANEYLSAAEWQAVFEEVSRFLEKEHPKFKTSGTVKFKELIGRAASRIFKRK